jgi:FixJ family two-component response regulator
LCQIDDCVRRKRFRRLVISAWVVRVASHAMISIVDDDKSVRDAAEEFLESGRLPDTACLITDVQMPGMSGVDLQSHLMASGHCTPVIFVTAYPEERIRERALNAGAFGFLSKPFSEESLIACLDRALGCDHSSSLD